MPALAPMPAPRGYCRPLRRHVESCGRKQQYLTRAEAQAAIDGWLGWRSPLVQVYECTACGGYHLGRYAGAAD